MRLKTLLVPLVAATVSVAFAACGGDAGSDSQKLTVYSGREEEIVAPLFPKFTAATGIDVEVRYGKSAELAAQIAEEGDNSPADIFFAQDAGALGSIADQLAPLPASALERVDAQFKDPNGKWIGVSGRVRVVAYNTTKYTDDQLPDAVLDYAKPEYAKRMGIAPTNASFQAFVTAMRLSKGDDVTRTFLTDLKANGAKLFDSNRPIVDAIAAGEIDLGLVNHYYLALLREEQPDAPVANKFLASGDPGALVNIAGVGIVTTTGQSDAAGKFVDYLLSDEGQRFYATDAEENEYPLVAGIDPADGLPPLSVVAAKSPPLSDFGKEEKATLDMLVEVGLTS